MKMVGTTAREIAEAVSGRLTGGRDARVSDVTHDSRQAGAGVLFVAVRGLTMDGHRFVDDVMRRGAVGIISELEAPADFRGVWLQVADARSALARAAAVINGDPSSQLDLVGITGTNGKTTTTYLMFSLARAAGVSPAMLTTVEYKTGDASVPAVRTTPEASDTERFLRGAVEKGCGMAAMEASSQAIDLHRCDWLHFRTAVFTNLTRDHLDYHGDMETYFDAKKKLFDGRLGYAPAASIINVDDEYGVRLASELAGAGQRVVKFGIESTADLTADDIDVSMVRGTRFRLSTSAGTRNVTSPLVGKPHVYNILSAAGAALELGYDLDRICEGIAVCKGAPGRFERVPNDGDFAVIVDYAHTDDALLNTLKTARELTRGRIITVFGCGGDRDRSKRVPMGEVAGHHSDLVVITSDNPRTEDPLKIISEVVKGVTQTNCPFLNIPDRREAIFQAVKSAAAGDVVIIAGKGHETYQIVGNDKFHFDDREAAREALRDLEIE
jgi:UDP-N-acetylmuramoyl-L-alanyl-D-glutamate--2,6-diaminopimelate ligase